MSMADPFVLSLCPFFVLLRTAVMKNGIAKRAKGAMMRYIQMGPSLAWASAGTDSSRDIRQDFSKVRRLINGSSR
jgi:hypothetical protein